MPRAKSEHQVLNRIIFCLVGATTLAAIALASPGVDAARWADATASVTVESTCSMTATVNTAHTATLVNGIYSGSYTTGGQTPYADGIGQTTIQTFCNDQSGFQIYAIGYTNNELGNTVMKGAGLSSIHDIATGTATSGSAGNDVSNWAMKVTAVSSDANDTYTPSITNGFSSFSAIPSTYTKVAQLNKATDSVATTNLGSTITTTYAAYISNTQPAGTYTGQVKYALVHPNHTAAPSVYYMQDIADWKGELLPNIQYSVVDNRDGHTYTVALLDDGEIWMTQNLDLCIGCADVATLTSDNTDLRQYDTVGDGTGTTFSGYNYNPSSQVITWTPSDATLKGAPATISNFTYTSSANDSVSGWSNTNTGAKMAEGQDVIVYNGTKFETTTTDGVKTTALSKCITVGGHTEAECLHYQVGNYYNWSAAVAMNSTSSYSDNYTVMPNSICPAGWRLPNGPTSTTTISDFNTLLNTYDISNGNDYGTGESSINVGFKTDGFTKINSAPLYFARSGVVDGSTLYNFSAYGYYWSSTVYSGDNAYTLNYTTSGGLYPARRSSRYDGRSVRCMAR